MPNQFDQPLSADLKLPWIVVIVMVLTLLTSLIACHSVLVKYQLHLPVDQRELLRTIFYVVAIITLPMTNLLRHIQLRLNQTMPGNKSAKSRYLVTVVVSMASVEMIGTFGLVMFLLGDGFNTLYIFTIVAALGIYLYRPKMAEYIQIIEKLADQR
jgi:phosphatidylglycerophosphate synthase